MSTEIGGQEGDIIVELHWNDYDTGLFTDKLYRHIRNGELDFSLDARRGSLLTTFNVSVTAATTREILVDIIGYLWRRRQRRRDETDNALYPPEVIILIEGDDFEVTLTTEEDLERAETLVEAKVEEDQSNLDDF